MVSKDLDTFEDLNCIDWDDENPFVIYGNPDNLYVQSLEIQLVPCSYGGKNGELEIPSGCNASLQQQLDYIGEQPQLVIL